MTLTAPNQINALLTLSNGLVASAGYTPTAISLWNVTTGTIQKTLIGHTDVIWGLSETKIGLLLSASVDHSLRIWNVITGANSKLLSAAVLSFRSVLELSTGFIAGGSTTGDIEIWNANAKKLNTTLKGHTNVVISLISMSNGSLISGSYDRSFKVWDVNTYKCLNTQALDVIVASLLILANEMLAVGSDTNTIRLFNMLSSGFVFVKELNQAYAGAKFINKITELPNGLIYAASDDKTIKLWNTTTGDLLSTLQGHSNIVKSVAQTADGRLVSGSWDKKIKIWSNIFKHLN